MSTDKRDASAPDLDSIITEDGILDSILSSLPLREAARTRLLSRRWGQLRTHRRRILKFDAENMFGAPAARSLDDYYRSNRSYETKNAILTDKFVESVDSVLQQNQGSRVEKFWVWFYLDKTHSHHLDAWLRFAVESRSKMIAVDLLRPYSRSPGNEPYEFPCQLFAGHQGLAVECLGLSSCSLKLHIGFSGLNNLKTLQLVRIDVSDEDVKCLLSNCSTLESLTVCQCPQLGALSTSHPLSRLQYLRVWDCHGVKKIDIKARNLTKFYYGGVWADFKFRESSQLKISDIYFYTFDNMGGMDFALTTLSSKLPHLVNLKLEMRDAYKVPYLPKNPISFTHLKKLDWILDAKMSLPWLMSFLNAAPLLEILLLDFHKRVVEKPPRRLKNLWRNLPKQPRIRLKTVYIGHFYGDKWQAEIALYLLNNAINLKTVKIKTCQPSDEDILKYIGQKFPTIIVA